MTSPLSEEVVHVQRLTTEDDIVQYLPFLANIKEMHVQMDCLDGGEWCFHFGFQLSLSTPTALCGNQMQMLWNTGQVKGYDAMNWTVQHL